MQTLKIDAYFIPMTDPHMGEYVPDHWKTIKWLTGFSGSAGNVVITQDFAGLWTDSRYFIQAGSQLKGSGFELVKLKIPHTPEFIDWLEENLSQDAVLAFDGEIVSKSLYDQMYKGLAPKGIQINPEVDLYSELWTDRPDMPCDMIYEHEVEFAGLSITEKLKKIREEMKKKKVDFHILSSLDDIAWTLNFRARDVKYSPLVISFLVIAMDRAWLFINYNRLPELMSEKLINERIRIIDYEWVYEFVKTLKSGGTVYLSPGNINIRLFKAVEPVCKIVEGISIPTRLKSVKNAVELSHIRNLMVKDGVALTRFFYWLEKSITREEITELSASEKLRSFRSDQDNFMGLSFATIAAYREHGAIIHYEPTEETDVVLKPEGIFLLDSGGQYLDGTTDITRTITLGEPTAEQKKHFTLVLKGTIQLAMTRFPQGTKGFQIEAFARRALWDHGLNYGHGTGHGVGFFLNVHEGPQTIGSAASGNMQVSLEPGMLISDEPGFYLEGEYGIRTENLFIVEKHEETTFGNFYRFRTVTLCYIDTQLIDTGLMLPSEIEWLNEYHKRVYSEISPFLKWKERKWLKRKTMPLK